MLHLVTFGGLRIASDGEAAAPHLRRSWLAMLAVIAASGAHGISRGRFMAIFWPESNDEHARQSARQALYSLRQELSRDVIRSDGLTLAIDPGALDADVMAFKVAVAAGDARRAIAIAQAPFLEGFHLPSAPGFERWVEEESARIAGMRTGALHGLASDAMTAGRLGDAVEYWRLLTEAEPLNGRHAVGYLTALAARGDRATALAFARLHEATVRRELDVDPDLEVTRLEKRLRAMDAVSPTSPVPAEELVPRAGPATDAPPVEAPAPVRPRAPAPVLPRRRFRIAGLAAVAGLGLAMVLWLRSERTTRGEGSPVFAVGPIHEVNIPDSARVGRVLTDMLATNLARIDGLRVVANARLLQLLDPAIDSSVGYADAARRAGASDLLEGQLIAGTRGLVLQLRRIELRSGMVREAFSVTAANRFQLVDSITVAVADRFRLDIPPSSVAATTTPSAVAHRFFEEGLRAWAQDDVPSARRLMRAALVEDSTFAMAAYSEAMLARFMGDLTPDGRHASIARRVALRLAARAPERERLTITANVLADDFEPAALAVAETLATRYPLDPAAHSILGRVRFHSGEWPGAVRAFEQAIAIDSAAGSSPRVCRVCPHLNELAEVYLWADSLGAAERTARRHLALRPNGYAPLYQLAVAAARRGDTSETYARFNQLLASGLSDRWGKLLLDLRLEHYERFERGLPELLAYSARQLGPKVRWYLLIALRNEGRLREAEALLRTGAVPDRIGGGVDVVPDAYNEAILALARGEARSAATIFETAPVPDPAIWSDGHVFRGRAWLGTLAGMAWDAAGDTSRVRAWADSVERLGRRTLYGRDRRSHHYLRGLLHAAAGRAPEAIQEFRAAIHSPTLGFTGVNVALARALLRQRRPREAVAALQPALRGELDAANLYVTRTELHELLAEAFDRAGQSDSAATHYGAVVRAWRRADPAYHGRRARAARRLAELLPSAGVERSPAPE